MTDVLDWGAKIFPWLQQAPWWLKLLCAAWVALTATIAISAVFVRSEPDHISGQWPTTNDIPVDQAHKRLNSIRASGDPSDQILLDALKPLFLRSLYRDIRSEAQPLFAICRTQILLTTYVSSFKAPDIRNALISVNGALSNVQGQFATIYGPAFEVQTQCSQFGTDTATYAKHLPGRTEKLTDQKIEVINSYLRQVRAVLRPVGLIDFDPDIDSFTPTPIISADESVLTAVGQLPSSLEDRSYRSDSNPTPATANVFFFNGTHATLGVIWLTQEGLQQKYTDLEPGASYVQPTYEGHLWMLADSQGRPLAMYRAQKGYQKIIYRAAP
jgi:hypothetical protein